MYSEPNYERTKLSDECVDLLKCLLKKEIKNRILPKDIPSHPWFKNIDFTMVANKQISPPFKPKTVKIYFLINFRKI